MSIFAEYGHFSQTNVQSGQENSGNFPYSTIHEQKGRNQYVGNEMVNEAKMKSGTIINENQDSSQHTHGINEALLRSEISFWDDMITGCGPSHPLDSLERMQQALALAESRLATLPRGSQHANASDTLKKLPSNVYSISRNSASRARKSKLPG
jgi:hypothetical protein